MDRHLAANVWTMFAAALAAPVLHAGVGKTLASVLFLAAFGALGVARFTRVAHTHSLRRLGLSVLLSLLPLPVLLAAGHSFEPSAWFALVLTASFSSATLARTAAELRGPPPSRRAWVVSAASVFPPALLLAVVDTQRYPVTALPLSVQCLAAIGLVLWRPSRRQLGALGIYSSCVLTLVTLVLGLR